MLCRRRPPRGTPFPYTTLFRSEERRVLAHRLARGAAEGGDRRIREALPAGRVRAGDARTARPAPAQRDRKSTRLNSSHSQISYAVFCLKKKKWELCG